MFLKSIFSQYEQKKEIHVHVRHKRFEEFLFSDSFEIQIGSSSFQEIGSKPPTIEEIINKISAENREEKDFIQAIQTSSLRFTDQAAKKHQEKIVNCLEGELYVENELHFKIKKMWYVLEWDHLALLHEDFTKVIKNVLIEENTEGWLPIPWEGNSGGKPEEMYNRSYLKRSDEGYVVFDQICPDNIEPCDVLKYTNDAVYLYHVKEKFGQHTRDACSQILNAATVIRSATAARQSSNYLQKLWSQATDLPEDAKGWKKNIKTTLEEKFEEESFIKIFRNRKIIFVYAYLPRSNQSLSNLLKAMDKPIKERLYNKLIDSGYLDSFGRLTKKFFSTNKKDFTLEGKMEETSEKMYNQLVERRFSKSTLAKVELVQLAQNLRNLDFEFKICEIPRKSAKRANTSDIEATASASYVPSKLKTARK